MPSSDGSDWSQSVLRASSQCSTRPEVRSYVFVRSKQVPQSSGLYQDRSNRSGENFRLRRFSERHDRHDRQDHVYPHAHGIHINDPYGGNHRRRIVGHGGYEYGGSDAQIDDWCHQPNGIWREQQQAARFGPSGYRDSKLRSVTGKKTDGNAQPFVKAMRHLYRQLRKADEFYTTFLTGFNNDIRSIEKYATPEILHKLWTLKIEADPASSTHEHDEYYQQDEIEEFGQKFHDTRRRIIGALKSAKESTLASADMSSKSVTVENSRKRLLEKVKVAYHQINELLDDMVDPAIRSRDTCDALLKEIKFLMALVDPENNRELYRGSSLEEADGED